MENPLTRDIDKLPTLKALELINNEDQLVPLAIKKELATIEKVVEKVTERLKNGGRLFYVGTGTSGRLGVLDAAELPPTFGVDPELVQGVIAGGYQALYKASEASEDDKESGAKDLENKQLKPTDAVIGIAASGRTPYTIGAVEYARKLGCFTAAIVCTPNSQLEKTAELAIVALVGPEVIAGSTRMKAGTAQKIILNMISTLCMIKLGFVKGNRMTHLRPTNSKLVDRSLRILMAETGLDFQQAKELLEKSGGSVAKALNNLKK
ncbi:MAG TPA: N-acetylmuramic acid 6-phosphate etherase [Pyrinomonadaceae bacterium]|nr:N-acetylmuramic acid 6-phosphate etherase [Pyrinomonadaceae bacterium]